MSRNQPWSESDLEAAKQRMMVRGAGTSPTVSPARRTSESLERPSPLTQSFFVAGPLPGANDIIRKHWKVYTRLKSLWGQRVGMAILAAKIQRVNCCHVHFEWREQSGNLSHRRDPDNIMFGQKFVLDALTNGWIIPDDSMDEILSLSHKFVTVQDSPGVLVTLTEVPE